MLTFDLSMMKSFCIEDQYKKPKTEKMGLGH